VKQLGLLGIYLYKRLVSANLIDVVYPTLREQWAKVDQLCVSGMSCIDAAAYSLLMCDFPVQVRLSFEDIRVISDVSLRPFPRDGVSRVDLSEEGRSFRFDVKSHPGAEQKVNVYFKEVWHSLKTEYPVLANQLCEIGSTMMGLKNDQASAAVLMLPVLSGVVYDPARYVVRMLRDQVGASQVSMALKALGCNADTRGCRLIELHTLQGRGVKSLDLESETRGRCDETLCDTVTVDNVERFRQVVRHILSYECPRNIVFEDVDKFWQRRWGWCVNGSHSRLRETNEGTFCVNVPGRLHRRAYSEMLEENPLKEWNNVSYFNASEKLEHGKTRVIYSCDSVTYFNFEHLLRPVERVWKGVRVELNPGNLGTTGMARRVLRMKQKGSVNIMLDYDDFNSQHSLVSQKIVIEELCKHVGYDEVMTSRLLGSFDRSRVFVTGKDMGYLKGTLMSGHRCTSFVNSILNYAYLLYYVPEIEGMQSIHVGDDVYISAPTIEATERIMNRVKSSPLRMNPMKQSIGFLSAEFLRIAHTETHANGYIARAIASTISGNWVSLVRASAEEGLNSMLSNAWTIMNRSCDRSMSKMLVNSFCRITGCKKGLAQALLAGEVAVNDGPIYGRSHFRRKVRMTIGGNKPSIDYDELSRLPKNATTAYLTNYTSRVERLGLELVGSGVRFAMLDSSYRKTLTSNAPDVRLTHLNFSPIKVEFIVGSVTAEVVLERQPVRGVLSTYPILQLIRHQLSNQMLAKCIQELDVEVDPYDIEKQAWGSEARGVICDGYIPYSDARHLGSRMTEDVLKIQYPIYA